MLIPENSVHTVKFSLFGKFKVTVDGHEVTFPDVAFFTYLKLTLLSGKPIFDYIEASGKGLAPKAERDVIAGQIRDVLDRGNLGPPERGGRFDFTRLTGLNLRYRAGYGIELRGTGWQCDVHILEEFGVQPSKQTDDDLRLVLALYGSGIELQGWKKDDYFIECHEWIKERVGILREYRKDIQAELDRRQQSKQPETVVGEGSQKDGQAGGLSDDANCHETSGSTKSESSFEYSGEPSAALGDDLRGDIQDDPVRVGIDSGAEDGNVEPSQADSEPKAGADAVPDQNGPTHPENSSNLETEKTGSEPRRIFLPVSEPRRTATRAGMAVACITIAAVFAIGWMAAKLTAPSQEERTNRAPNDQKASIGTVDRAPKASPTDDPDYNVRAKANPVDLSGLYLKDTSGVGVTSESGDTVIGHQIFTGYMWARADDGGETAGVFDLGREYKTLNCLIGVPDEDGWKLEAPARRVVFEGDGQVLKRVAVDKGSAVSVEIPVKDVKALVIIFRQPVVIVNAKVWR